MLGADRPVGETYVFVPFRDGRPVLSVTTKPVTNLWSYPNLDALPAPHLTDLSGDPLVDALLGLLASTATRVQSELDGTSTEPCFAEQIASGLLQNGGIPEFDMAVGARLLGLEWDIDASQTIALFESLADEN